MYLANNSTVTARACSLKPGDVRATTDRMQPRPRLSDTTPRSGWRQGRGLDGQAKGTGVSRSLRASDCTAEAGDPLDGSARHGDGHLADGVPCARRDEAVSVWRPMAGVSHSHGMRSAPRIGADPVTSNPAMTYEQVFVILRVDTTTSRVSAPETAVAVLKALWSEAAAEAEVARLNQSNQERGYAYFWKSARVERRLAEASAR